jgi:hypothetical protein
MVQTDTVTLQCRGETDEAYLFHGMQGDTVQHLSIAKEEIPWPVGWVRVTLEIHRAPEIPGDTGV